MATRRSPEDGVEFALPGYNPAINSRHVAKWFPDRITVSGKAADDVGGIALERLASEKDLPVFVMGPSDYHQYRVFVPSEIERTLNEPA